MTIAFVNSGCAWSPNSNGFTSGSFDTTGADFIVVNVSSAFSSAETVSDSKGNTWIALDGNAHTGLDPRQRLYYCYNAIVGTGHTFSITGTNTFPTLYIEWFSGVKSSADPIDGSQVVDMIGYDDTLTVGPYTPSIDDCLVIAGLAANRPTSEVSIDDGFTKTAGTNNTDFGHNMGGIAYLIQTTAATAEPTWTIASSTTIISAIVAFQPAGAPGAPVPGPIKHRESAVFVDNDLYIRQSGVWQRVDVMYRRESGQWVRYM